MSQDIIRRERSGSNLQSDPNEDVIEAVEVVSQSVRMQSEAGEAQRAKEMAAYIKQAQTLIHDAMNEVTGGPKRDRGPPYINLGPKKCAMVAMIHDHICVETCKDNSDTLRNRMEFEDEDCKSHGFYTSPTNVSGHLGLNAACLGIHNVSYYGPTSAASGASGLAGPGDDGGVECGDVYHSLVDGTADADHMCQTLCVGVATSVKNILAEAGAQPGNCTSSDVGYTKYLGTMEVRIVIKITKDE